MIVLQNDENANRDSEIAAIFNPKRVRTPSVVVTNESPNNGPSQLANIHQITHSDSVTSSQPDGAESLTGVIIGDHITDHSHQQTHALIQSHANQLPRSASTEHEEKAKGCRGSCCAELAQKVSHDLSQYQSKKNAELIMLDSDIALMECKEWTILNFV